MPQVRSPMLVTSVQTATATAPIHAGLLMATSSGRRAPSQRARANGHVRVGAMTEVTRACSRRRAGTAGSRVQMARAPETRSGRRATALPQTEHWGFTVDKWTQGDALHFQVPRGAR